MYLAASCILANMAMATGRPLIYDPKIFRGKMMRRSNGTLQRDYRAPWTHPHPK